MYPTGYSGNRHLTKENEMQARHYTDKLLGMLAYGEVDENTVIDACLRYMSEDDVRDMMKANEFIPTSKLIDN